MKCRIRKALENRTNMEDDRVAILEAQLAQAKQIAEEADKKYEEVVYSTNLFKKKVRDDTLSSELGTLGFFSILSQGTLLRIDNNFVFFLEIYFE